jgi:hypothetical protein
VLRASLRLASARSGADSSGDHLVRKSFHLFTLRTALQEKEIHTRVGKCPDTVGNLIG